MTRPSKTSYAADETSEETREYPEASSRRLVMRTLASLPSLEDLQLELGNPVSVENGRSTYQVRCRIPFSHTLANPMQKGDFESRRDLLTAYEGDDDDQSKVPVLLETIASSTSVDFYGTEMSLPALQSMAVQMTQGIPFVPLHRDAEWMSVIGETMQAAVVPGEIEKAADPTEQGYLLRVVVRLDMTEELAVLLVDKLEKKKMTIGTSIGGWFTSLKLIVNDDGDIERMIVEGIELDHLAVTRAPANPDSWILSLRSTIADAVQFHTGGVVPSQRDAEDAPSYRPSDDSVRSCSTCAFFEASENDDGEIGNCLLWDFRDGLRARGTYVCESWKAVDEETERLDELLNGKLFQKRHIIGVDADEESVTIRFERGDSPAPEEEGRRSSLETRGVVPFHDLPIEVHDEWSFTTEEMDEVLGQDGDNFARFEMAHVWMDPEADMMTKEAYKLPIAKMMGTQLTAFFSGVAEAMAMLNGARGGVDIPELDREPVYNHLVHYYIKAEMEPPPLRSLIRHSELLLLLAGENADEEHVALAEELVGLRTELSRTNPELFDSVEYSIPSPTTQADGRSSDLTPPTTNDEVEMTEEQLALLMASIEASTNASQQLSAQVGALAERVTAQATPTADPPPAETPEPPKPAAALSAEQKAALEEVDSVKAELAALKTRTAEQEATIRRLASEPVRRGMAHHMSGPSGEGTPEPKGVRQMAEMAKEQGAVALSALASDDDLMEKVFGDEYAFEGESIGAARRKLERVLRTALNCALSDGVLTEPALRAKWG